MYDRSLGFVAVAEEDVAYGTAGTSLVYQHGISVNPTFNENRVVPPVLGSNAASNGYRLSSHWTGNVTLALSDEQDDLAVIYGNMASLSTSTWTFGGTPENDSLTLFYDYNGVEHDVVGGVIQSINWNLANNDFSTLSFDMIGRAATKYTGSARTPSIPPAGEITTPANISAVVIASTSLTNCTGASITYTRQVTAMDRQRLGASNLPQPVVYGRPTIEATFTFDLDDNSVDYLDDLIEDNLTGNISVTQDSGSFAMTNAKVMGALPTLERGLGTVDITFRATTLTVVTA